MGNTIQLKKLGVIGIGVMGKTLIQALINKSMFQDALTAKNSLWAAAKTEASCQRAKEALGIHTCIDYQEELKNTQVILLCIKPSRMTEVLQSLREKGMPADTLVISIAAGVTLAQIETVLVTPNPVIRAMPNTPCVVGSGMTVLCGGSFCKPKHLALAEAIFSSVGTCLQLEESRFDAATGLCASGPAYLFLVMEALADGGVRMGLPRDTAISMVAQTMLGAAMMVKESGSHPAALRDDVTTPAGCTIAGLLTLEDGKIRSVLARAVEEAAITASKLGDSLSP